MHTNSTTISDEFALPNGEAARRDFDLAGSKSPTTQAQWWFDGRDASEPELWAAVERSNCAAVLATPDQLARVSTQKQRIFYVVDADALERLEHGAWVLTPHEELRAKATGAGHRAGLLIEVEDLESGLPRGIEVCERGDDFVVVDIEHATYIPYELLLAKTERRSTRILRSVPIKGLDGHVDDIHQSMNAFAHARAGRWRALSHARSERGREPQPQRCARSEPHDTRW